MIEIGSSLAAARRARGLDLRDAEGLTCMRRRYLVALEAERFDDLPGRTYARAFLRTYANALGLRADAFVAAFDEQVPEPPEPEPVRAGPRTVTATTWRVSTAAAMFALLGILVWSAWSSGGSAPSVSVGPAPAVAAKPAPTTHVLAAHKTVDRRLVVRASGGPCWVQARRGGATGPVLFERTLQPGESVRFAAPNVWLRLGAPWNITVRRGANALRLPAVRAPVNVSY